MKPKVRVIPIDKLFVDERYQRSLGATWVSERAPAFDELMLGVGAVSLRADGTLALLDGQHRVELCRVVGSPTMLFRVYEDLTPEDEARLFVALKIVRRWPARVLKLESEHLEDHVQSILDFELENVVVAGECCDSLDETGKCAGHYLFRGDPLEPEGAS